MRDLRHLGVAAAFVLLRIPITNTLRRRATSKNNRDSAVITTDASMTGGGYVIQQQSEVRRMAFPWRKRVEPRHG